MTWHANLPWGQIIGAWRWMRRTFFTKDKPDTNAIIVEATEDGLLTVLGKEYFSPNEKLSYYYKSEDLNVARRFRAPHPVRIGSNVEWMQDHIRAWDVGGYKWEIRAHREPSAFHHPVAHLKGDPFSRDRPMRDVGQILRDADPIDVVEGRFEED